MSQKEYFGSGAIENLKEQLSSLKPNKVLLITGNNSYQSSGAREAIEPLLSGTHYERFYEFKTNPNVEDIKKGIKIFKANQCDLTIAIGGGSCIDMAKAINALANQEGNLEDYITGKRSLETSPGTLIAIPTTAGTGSESTHFAVVYIGKTKYSLAHQKMLPTVAILDPNLTINLPQSITAATGMDALGQAIEAHWSTNSTEESRKYSMESIKLGIQNLEQCVNNPNEQLRENMLRASNLAGRAINIAKTTAAHAVSYPITSHFGAPHGHAVGLTLPSFILYNSQLEEGTKLNDTRGRNFVKERTEEIVQALGCETPEQAKELLTKLMGKIGLETRLSKLGVTEEGIQLIIKNGFNPQRVKNNPKDLSEEDLRLILTDIF
jgi:alcohol dehydrogenase